MKKVGLYIATAVMLVLFAFSVSAKTEGYYTYEVENGEATITGVDTSISGNVTIPSTLGGYKVTSIGNYAFYFCNRLTRVTIPDSVTSIGSSAFKDCTSLTSISIPDSITNIDQYAFEGCSSLTKVYITDIANWCKIKFGYKSANPLRYAELYLNEEKVTDLVIPDGVTRIGDYAFYNYKHLTSITIPNSVTTIGPSSFDSCSNLSNVILSEGVVTIDNYAFSGCVSLTRLTIPDSVIRIGYEAFYCCISLEHLKMPVSATIDEYAFDCLLNLKTIVLSKGTGTLNSSEYSPWQRSGNNLTVIIEDGVTSIANNTFSFCTNLQSVTIPDSVTSIGDYAFSNCESLTSVTIPDSVTSIEDRTFVNCTSLTSLTIPDSVTSIGDYAFSNCESLTSVTIPDSVTSIGYSAFSSCPIKDVYYTGTRSQWKAIAIKSGNSSLTNATIHYTHKNIVDIPQQNPTCTKVGYTEGKLCSDCKEWVSGHETIAKLGHSYSSSYTIDKKATLSANGSKSKHCTRDVCTAKTSVTAIARVSSVTLSKTNYIYDGKNKTPKVTVKDADGKTLIKNVDYKLTVASKRSGIGRYTVKVTFMGNYSGSKSVYFYIKPGKPATVKSASQTVSSVKISWSAVPGAAGYTVYRYSPSKKVYVKAGTTEGTSLTVKSLYAGTKYTFRVVAYGKTSAGKVYESDSYALLKTATKTKTPILSDYAVYKGKVKLFWTATSGETGYTIYYSTKKDSGFKKYANYESNSGYVKNLTSGKTYYFKVRTYIKTDSGYVYSDWSNIKSVKVK